MKKVIKSMLFTFILFTLCGCDVKYKINITDGMQVEDQIQIDFPTVYADLYYKKPIEYVQYMYEAKSEEFGVTGYQIQTELGEDTTHTTLTSTTSNISNYFSNSPFKMMYNNISVQQQNGNIIVKLSGLKDIFGKVTTFDDLYDLSAFDIVIRSDYMITNTNADDKNLSTGEYIWHFEEGTLAKPIEFTITDTKNYSAIVVNSLGFYLIPIILLVILIICYIIYVVFKRKFDAANAL